MKAIEVLMDEHRVIEQVLNCLEKMSSRCEKDGRLDPDPARDAVAFFRAFADRCHHAKEEEQLFPMMEEHGFATDSGPTAVMRAEHEQGRALVQRIDLAIEGASAGRPDDTRAFVQNSRAYIHLLRDHIYKEDHCLFPMAREALGGRDREALLQHFDRVEREEIGEDTSRTYLRMANELAEKFDVPRADMVASHSGSGGNAG